MNKNKGLGKNGYNYLGIIALIILGSCSQSGEYSKIDENARAYFFGDDPGSITFMGMPFEGEEVSCDPNTNSQGYKFKLIDDVMMIESIRPSSKIMHRVVYIRKMGNTFSVNAVNGVEIPFTLSFKPIDSETAMVSYSRSYKSEYKRCFQ